MPAILQNEATPKIIFWLDAHYSEPESYQNEPPILSEIDIINNSGIIDPVIIIDDARYILGTSSDERYYLLPEFMNTLHNKCRYISCAEDKFIAVPTAYSHVLDLYTNQINADNWQYYLAQSQDFSLPQKILHICQHNIKKWLPKNTVTF